MQSTGICPKCKSQEIYTNRDEVKRGDRSLLAISNWKGLFIDVYLCVKCGYMEEYITPKDLQDPKTMEKLRKEWKKM